MDRATRKRAIAEQLWRLNYYREEINRHRGIVTRMESAIQDDLERINEAKRSLYELGVKDG